MSWDLRAERALPERVVELDVIGTDPARAVGLSDRLVAHYNATWLGEDYPADPEMVGHQRPSLDGIWATAPYLHNGSVPTLATLLKSADRPARFERPRRPGSSTTIKNAWVGSLKSSPTPLPSSASVRGLSSSTTRHASG